MPIDTYLFDVGNVLLSFDFRIAASRIEKFCQVPGGEILPRVEVMKDDLESGKISPDEFLDSATDVLNYSGSREFLVESFQDIFELNEAMVPIVEEESAQGSNLFLLSNTNGIHVPFFLGTYPVFEHFSGSVFSHEAGSMKPSPEIYEIAITQLGLVPEQTIYIDDLEDNCEAGESFGFRTIRYDLNRHDDFLRELDRLREKGD